MSALIFDRKDSWKFMVLLMALGTFSYRAVADTKNADEIIRSIKFGPDMPADSVRIIKADLAYLAQLKITYQDPGFNRALGISQANGNSLLQWFAQRVKHIFGQSYDWKASFKTYTPTSGAKFSYPAPEVEPDDSEKDVYVSAATTDGFYSFDRTKSGNIQIIASNFGIDAYLKAKKMLAIAGVDLPGLGFFPVNSPRDGLIKTGPAMFKASTRLDSSGSRNIETAAHRILRMSYLFHEARHSDGNGKTLGFLHIKCPPGHPLAGNEVCERSTNGPYSIGGWTLKFLAEFCKECDAAEKEGLRLLALENFSRVILKTKKILNHEEMQTCEIAKKQKEQDPNFVLPEFCQDVIVTKDWDATPEFVQWE